MIFDLANRIKRRWIKMRLQPIRVFCFHQVSDEFDESTMYPDDWLQTDEFKRRVLRLQQKGYKFISLPEAHERLKQDRVRCKKYAVLTADDGWATLRNVLPWLNENGIPITLFINPGYLDGKHFRDRKEERYLTEDEMQDFPKRYPLLTVGSHGWEHIHASKQTEQDFEDSVNRSVAYLNKYPNYIPYYAYTYGRHKQTFDIQLIRKSLIPVFVSGSLNYNNEQYIDRELL